MIKRILAICIVLACCFSLTGCLCKHEWAAASCAEPSKCINCGKTEGEPLGHNWKDANCTDAKTCQLCSVTEGQPLGHDWLEADCLNPASCTRCSATEGEALGHDWHYATTEAPKTCMRCALTEGEPIVTDPRFKTAPAEKLIGKWKFDTAVPAFLFNLPESEPPVRIRFITEFAPDGSYTEQGEVLDETALMESLVRYSTELSYLAMEAQGISREAADALIQEAYGMSVYDYAKHTMGETSFNQLLSVIFETMNTGGVYYVENGTLYTGLTWESPMNPSEFIADDKGLWISYFDGELGPGTVFQPMVEE